MRLRGPFHTADMSSQHSVARLSATFTAMKLSPSDIQLPATTCAELEFLDRVDYDVRLPDITFEEQENWTKEEQSPPLHYGYSARYDDSEYSVEPRFGNVLIPKHLIGIIQQDAFDLNSRGDLHGSKLRITNEKLGSNYKYFEDRHDLLTDFYNMQNIGPSTVEAVLYSRKRKSPCQDIEADTNTTAPQYIKRLRNDTPTTETYTQTILFHSHKKAFKNPQISRSVRAAHQTNLDLARRNEQSRLHRLKGGIALRVCATIKDNALANEYADAFEAWDRQMRESGDPHFKLGYGRRRNWAIEMWDCPGVASVVDSDSDSEWEECEEE